jgi:hypothetical protein
VGLLIGEYLCVLGYVVVFVEVGVFQDYIELASSNVYLISQHNSLASRKIKIEVGASSIVSIIN